MLRIFAIVGFLMLLVWGHLYAKPMHGQGGTPITNFILLVNGTSFILQTDAASKICRAGGC